MVTMVATEHLALVITRQAALAVQALLEQTVFKMYQVVTVVQVLILGALGQRLLPQA
jgi:hypothetical protein